MGQNINLLTALPTPTIVVFPTNTVMKILGSWLALLILIYGLGLLNLKSKEKDLSTLEKTKQTLTAQIDNATTTLNQLSQTKPALEIAPTSLTHTLGFSPYLEDLAKYTPKSIWLEVITFTEPGGTVTLQGSALSPALIPSFLNELSKSQSFKNKKFSTLQLRKDETNTLKFTLSNETAVKASPETTKDKTKEKVEQKP